MTGVELPAGGVVEEGGAGAGQDFVPLVELLRAVSTGGRRDGGVNTRRYGGGREG